MIDSVRSTVLAVLNKNNYGYLSPSDFNLFAKQAQLDIFKSYIEKYNDQINKENARRSGTDYADIRRKVESEIEQFFVSNLLTYNTIDTWYLPSISTTGDELFTINKVICYNSTGNVLGEAEKVSHGKVHMLLASNLTAPTESFPVYTQIGSSIKLYPATTFNQNNSTVECHYIRLPKAPKWTYISLTAGEPVFNQSANDYQDFEIGPDEEDNLVVKILQYASTSIREADVYSFAKTEQREEEIKQ